MYLLKTVDGTWESVDQYVFENRKFAIDAEGKPRYSDAWFFNAVTNSNPRGVVSLDRVTPTDLGIICRFLGVQAPTNSVPGGFVQVPETVQMKKGRSNVLYCLKTKEKWRKAA